MIIMNLKENLFKINQKIAVYLILKANIINFISNSDFKFAIRVNNILIDMVAIESNFIHNML